MTDGEIKYVGVDWSKSGWFSVGLDDGDGLEVIVFETFTELVDYYFDACLILVDTPIGFRDVGPGERACDTEARATLGRPRGSSVFPVPSRALLESLAEIDGDLPYSERYSQANELSRSIDGKGLARQSFGIAPTIIEVDGVVNLLNVEKRPIVREVHPEICFWALNDGYPTQYRKKSQDGVYERIGILERYIDTEYIFDFARIDYPNINKVGNDDILDALAAAVTAKLGCQDNQYTLQTLPANPLEDRHGLPMEMVYLAEK